METKKEIKKIFSQAVTRQLPDISRSQWTNVSVGTVVSYDAGRRTSTVRLLLSGQLITNAKLSKQVASLNVGDEVVIASNDGNFVGRNYIVSSFGGNKSPTLDDTDIMTLLTVNDAWVDFTPVWTNLTVGNGTQVAACKVIGTTVLLRAKLTFGSTTSVSGTIGIVLPFTVKTGAYNNIGHVLLLDSGGVNTEGVVDQSGILVVMTASGTYVGRAVVNATVPHTWATGDSIQLYATYETE